MFCPKACIIDFVIFDVDVCVSGVKRDEKTTVNFTLSTDFHLRAHSSAVEHSAHNRSVLGSNPSGPTKKQNAVDTAFFFAVRHSSFGVPKAVVNGCFECFATKPLVLVICYSIIPRVIIHYLQVTTCPEYLLLISPLAGFNRGYREVILKCNFERRATNDE
jgi:hypothetical protein